MYWIRISSEQTGKSSFQNLNGGWGGFGIARGKFENMVAPSTPWIMNIDN